MSSFTINNSKFFTKDKYTLVVGSFESISKQPHSITLVSRVTSTSHVILDKNTLCYFRDCMLKSPTTSNAIYVYDQIGNIVSRYEPKRKNNVSGTINISIEPISLLGNISFPDNIEEDDNIFLPITSYIGLDSVVSENYRSELLNADMEMFQTKINLTKVTLVIGKTLHSTIKNILTDYDYFELFKSVIVTDDSLVINYIVELLCGKVISGHCTSFQGFLNFGPNFEVIHSTICPVESNEEDIGSVCLTNRQGGRIQVYVNGQHGLASFIVILYNKDSEEFPYFIEETTTNTVISLTSDMFIDDSTFPSLSINYLNNYLDAIKFQKELQSTSDKNRLVFIQENTLYVVRYLFTSPQIDVEDIKNLTSMSRSIYNDYSHLINEIRTTLEQNMITSRIITPRRDLKLVRQLGFKNYFQSPSINTSPYLERTLSGINL